MKILSLLISFFLLACAQTKVSQTNQKASEEKTIYSGHGAESVSGETLKKYAPTAIPSDLASEIQSMIDVKAPGAGAITHDGKRLFFTWRVTGVAQVWRLNAPNSFPIQLTGGQDYVTIGKVAPNNKFVVVSRDKNGEENPGLYRLAVEGGPLKKVFQEKGVRSFLAHISKDSKRIYFFANKEKKDSYYLYEHNLDTGKNTLLLSEGGTWGLSDARGDDEFLLYKATGSLWAEYYHFDLKTKKLTPILGKGEKEEYEMHFAPKPGEYFVNTPRFDDFRRLYLFKEGKFTPVTKLQNRDLYSIDTDKAIKRIYLNWNDRGYSRLEVLDAKTLKPLPLPKFGDTEHVFAGSTSLDGRFVSISVETAKEPRSSYIYDWNTGKLTRWVFPSAPEIDTTRFVRARLDSYPARDGTPIPMFVREPAACAQKLCPVVVDFHGGPEAQSQPGFSPRAQLFLDRGFIYIEPNVRGSDGYGKKWLAADDGPKRLEVITDIEDAALYVRKKYARGGVSPKVGVMGGSYGGYSTLYAMTRFAGAYDAGVSSVGMSSLLTFLLNTAPYRRHLRISEYGDPEKDREALIALSPVTYMDRLKAPLLIIQGASDPRVPVGEAIQMHESLQRKNIPSQLVIFADEGHGAAKRENQVLEIGHTLAFFERHLK